MSIQTLTSIPTLQPAQITKRVNDTFVIERGIAIPPPAPGSGNLAGRPASAFTRTLKSLEVGESFAAEIPQKRAASRVRSFSKRNPGYYFSTRKVSPTRTRIWRTDLTGQV